MTTAGVTLILIVPVLLLAALFVREGIDATRSMQASIARGDFGGFGRAWEWFASHVAGGDGPIDLPGLVRQDASRVGEYMASELGRVVRNIVVFVFELFVMLFALFYFLRDGDAILDRFRFFLPFEEDHEGTNAGGGARTDFRERHDQPGDRGRAGIDLRRSVRDRGPGFAGVLGRGDGVSCRFFRWWARGRCGFPRRSGCFRPGMRGAR